MKRFVGKSEVEVDCNGDKWRFYTGAVMKVSRRRVGNCFIRCVLLNLFFIIFGCQFENEMPSRA